MVEVVGHRGAAGVEPENTLRGFRLAVELGADWTECDVHLTKDGRLVVMHDETVDRTTNGTGAVRDLTFKQIRALDAGQGERVPTLDEVLRVVRGKVRLEVELKGPEAEEAAVEAVKAAQMEREALFISFRLDWLCKVKRIDPTLEVAALFGEPPPDACRQAQAVGAGSVHFFYKNLTWGLVEEAHRLGLKAGAWNPDAEPEWRAMLALGVDFLSTNRPDALLAMLGRHPPRSGSDTDEHR